MFQLLKDPQFDFMRRRRFFAALSILLTLTALTLLFVRGLNLGIEFTGGTELQVRYAQRPDIGAIRSALGSAGMTSQVVTTIGDPAEHEVYIRLGVQSISGEEEDPTAAVLAALRGQRSGLVDLNIEDEEALSQLLRGAPGMSGDRAEQLAAAVLEARKENRIFRSVDDLAALPGMSPEVLDFLKQRAATGPLALRSQSYIGPAVGRELVRKALFAILGSMVGMLVYIWIRFQVQWGMAAVVALVHDTLVSLGLFSLFDMEMSLPVVAAFLTLIGYSVNDTVVIFDRIRENLGRQRGGDLEALINQSINQTLSRTILTSGLTWLVVFALFLLGGSALRSFSFVLTVGIIVGTYSTFYIASPILVLWHSLIERRKRRAAGEAKPAAERRSRKIRTSG